MTLLDNIALFIGWCILGPLLAFAAMYFIALIATIIRELRGA